MQGRLRSASLLMTLMEASTRLPLLYILNVLLVFACWPAPCHWTALQAVKASSIAVIEALLITAMQFFGHARWLLYWHS